MPWPPWPTTRPTCSSRPSRTPAPPIPTRCALPWTRSASTASPARSPSTRTTTRSRAPWSSASRTARRPTRPPSTRSALPGRAEESGPRRSPHLAALGVTERPARSSSPWLCGSVQSPDPRACIHRTLGGTDGSTATARRQPAEEAASAWRSWRAGAPGRCCWPSPPGDWAAGLMENPTLFAQQVVDGFQSGLCLRPHRPGLHHGLRHCPPDQLRPRRRLHGRRFISYYAVKRWHLHKLPGQAGSRRWQDWRPTSWARSSFCSSRRWSAWSWRLLIERMAYKPIREAPRINALITAIGVSFFLEYFGALQVRLRHRLQHLRAAL